MLQYQARARVLFGSSILFSSIKIHIQFLCAASGKNKRWPYEDSGSRPLLETDHWSQSKPVEPAWSVAPSFECGL